MWKTHTYVYIYIYTYIYIYNSKGNLPASAILGRQTWSQTLRGWPAGAHTRVMIVSVTRDWYQDAWLIGGRCYDTFLGLRDALQPRNLFFYKLQKIPACNTTYQPATQHAGLQLPVLMHARVDPSKHINALEYTIIIQHTWIPRPFEERSTRAPSLVHVCAWLWSLVHVCAWLCAETYALCSCMHLGGKIHNSAIISWFSEVSQQRRPRDCCSAPSCHQPPMNCAYVPAKWSVLAHVCTYVGMHVVLQAVISRPWIAPTFLQSEACLHMYVRM